MVNTTLTVEQVERMKANVHIEGNPDQYGVIRLTTALPPYPSEVRMSFTPFEKTNKRDKRFSKNNYTSSYILRTKEEVNLLAAVFRKAADMLEETARALPSREAIS